MSSGPQKAFDFSHDIITPIIFRDDRSTDEYVWKRVIIVSGEKREWDAHFIQTLGHRIRKLLVEIDIKQTNVRAFFTETIQRLIDRRKRTLN
ncbi:hypothetical protein MWN63_13215 [Paradonghicola geojensis]|nr:hypothetical protein [Marivivens geojensis]